MLLHLKEKKPIRHKITKLQSATIISLWIFKVCLHVLNILVIDQNIIITYQYQIKVSVVFTVR